MRIIKKKAMLALLAGVLTVAMVILSHAVDRKPIKSITLSIKANIMPDTGFSEGEIEIGTSSSRFSADGYDILNDDFEWRDDSVPKIRITPTADDDYYFQSFPKNRVTLKGEAQFLKASREDSSSTLLIDAELPSLSTSIHDAENLKLSGNGIAIWDPISATGSYEAGVYRNDKVVGSTIVMSTNTSNCRGRMTKGDTSYTVKVRAVSRFDGGEKGNWVDPASVYISSGQMVEFRGDPTGGNGAWIQSVGNGRWWYDSGNGTHPADSWKQIGDKWCFFDAQGYMQTGWIQWEGKEYYCSENGDMLINCTMADNYWVDEDGTKIARQCEVNDKN